MSNFLPKGKVKLVKGSIINPEYAGLRLVLNFVSESGKPEGKLSETLDKKWKKIVEETKGWYASRVNFKQGETYTIAVQSDTWVINCLCKDKDNQLQDKSLTSCLKKIAQLAKAEKASVHVSDYLVEECPSLSSMLETEMVNQGINVSYYQEV